MINLISVVAAVVVEHGNVAERRRDQLGERVFGWAIFVVIDVIVVAIVAGGARCGRQRRLTCSVATNIRSIDNLGIHFVLDSIKRLLWLHLLVAFATVRVVGPFLYLVRALRAMLVRMRLGRVEYSVGELFVAWLVVVCDWVFEIGSLAFRRVRCNSCGRRAGVGLLQLRAGASHRWSLRRRRRRWRPQRVH